LEPYELIIIGEKPNINLPFIHYEFIKDRNALSEIYNKVDLLIFPSKADTFPFTVLEAMACGVCVIGNDVCGITEQLRNGNGILFQQNQESDLLAKIHYSLSHLSEIRTIGNNASTHAKKQYSMDRMHGEYDFVYNTLRNIL
jgi:glycosyltransferase involved in cell wall biosynthesis